MERPEVEETPRKRQKINSISQTDGTGDELPQTEVMEDVQPSAVESAELPQTAVRNVQPSVVELSVVDAQLAKERNVGITEFVTSDIGYSGVFKKRYSDFMVNEIMPSGEVVHLRNLKAPASLKAPAHQTPKVEDTPAPTEAPGSSTTSDQAAAEFSVSAEDNVLLVEYFGADKALEIIALHKRAMSSKARPNEFGSVAIVTTDRELRTKIHQAIRRIFKSQLDSTTDENGNLSIKASTSRFKSSGQGDGRDRYQQRTGGRMSWEELGGGHLHFTIYKENKDTMEVIGFMSGLMKTNAKNFQFAGTKDRRGVTSQRASVWHVHASRLAEINKSLRNAAIGDYKYHQHGLDLGDLSGNEFVITLRDCQIPGVDLQDPEAALAKATEVVGSSLKNLYDRGYLNYYGLQRFGSFSTRTDTIGLQMLQGDFKGACESILHYSPHVLEAARTGDESVMIGSRDKDRAMAIHLFQARHQSRNALDKLPRKFSAEAALIRHLSRAPTDYLGALQAVPRNLRLMYVHAYQSLVFNFAVSERLRLYGDKVVEGDLVIVQEHRDKEESVPAAPTETVDADGEIIIVPQGADSANAAQDQFKRARALTAEEAASGNYSIFDIVLPQPGFDVIYPANKMTDFYRTFMASEKGGGLDPFDMKRKYKDVNLSGDYRKVFSRMVGSKYSFDVKLYSSDHDQFVQTDMDIMKEEIKETSTETGPQTGDKLAIVLKFQLGSSQYATMALRELTKGKATEHKQDMSGGR
ncbi:hypothetical protein N7495_002039 [Penicillium taxi]|uniref:uncharacterized protein n=1 Tax=Penicillium taxi TaxID=168475 RepID=UPI00254517F1|nr:uncharacterized protein N7495_002039 [Penicillium taxi]KAJ5901511.1 hypothetical protein N7495_002039 [Penicillium taxi]